MPKAVPTSIKKVSSTLVPSPKLSGLGSAPVSFGKVGKTTLKSDKDYVLELLHYNLIKEARAAGADALLGDISYEWKIEEKSDLQTRLFGLLPDKVVSKNVVYTVTGYSKTAKMVMDPHQAEDNSNDGGSAGTDIKLNLDISTEGSASGGSSSGTSPLRWRWWAVQEVASIPHATLTASLYSSQGRCFILQSYHFSDLSTVHTGKWTCLIDNLLLLYVPKLGGRSAMTSFSYISCNISI